MGYRESCTPGTVTEDIESGGRVVVGKGARLVGAGGGIAGGAAGSARGSGSLITSAGRNVRLGSGTQMLLVTGAAASAEGR